MERPYKPRRPQEISTVWRFIPVSSIQWCDLGEPQRVISAMSSVGLEPASGDRVCLEQPLELKPAIKANS
jgi:hypothetical protein